MHELIGFEVWLTQFLGHFQLQKMGSQGLVGCFQSCTSLGFYQKASGLRL